MRLLVAAVLVLLFTATASAAVRTYTVSGSVGTLADNSGLGYIPAAITSASTFTGTLSFDDAAPGTFSGNNAFYRGVALNMKVHFVIDNTYVYHLDTPSTQDEIDFLGTGVGLFKRGPTVYTAFAPNPPFSHVDFAFTGTTNRLNTATLTLGSPFAGYGLSDAQTAAPDYYLGLSPTTMQLVPEPASAALLLLAGGTLVLRRRRR